MDHGPPGSSVHGILQARILEWVPISFSSHKVWSEWSDVFIFYLERQIWAQMKAKQHVTLEKKQLCSEEKLTILRVSGIKSTPAKHVPLERCRFIFSSVQFSHVRLFATPWIAVCQASLSITISWSSLRLTSIESVMPSRHLILCHPLLLLPPIPPSIRVFSNESTLRMRWPQYWSFSFSIIPANIRDSKRDTDV